MSDATTPEATPAPDAITTDGQPVTVSPTPAEPEPTPATEADKVELADEATPDPSADADGDDVTGDPDAPVEHLKTFVLGGKHNEFSLANYDHSGNYTATRNYMISQGLRPIGDVEFVGSVLNADGISLDLTYRVLAIPAELATAPEVAHASATQIDAEANIEDDAEAATDEEPDPAPVG